MRVRVCVLAWSCAGLPAQTSKYLSVDIPPSPPFISPALSLPFWLAALSARRRPLHSSKGSQPTSYTPSLSATVCLPAATMISSSRYFNEDTTSSPTRGHHHAPLALEPRRRHPPRRKLLLRIPVPQPPELPAPPGVDAAALRHYRRVASSCCAGIARMGLRSGVVEPSITPGASAKGCLAEGAAVVWVQPCILHRGPMLQMWNTCIHTHTHTHHIIYTKHTGFNPAYSIVAL